MPFGFNFVNEMFDWPRFPPDLSGLLASRNWLTFSKTLFFSCSFFAGNLNHELGFLLFASIHGLNECKRGSICLSRESMTMWLYRSKFNVEAFKCHSPVFRFRFQHFQWVVHAMHCMDWWEIIRQWSQTSISRQLNTSNDNIYIFTSNGFEPISPSLSLSHTRVLGYAHEFSSSFGFYHFHSCIVNVQVLCQCSLILMPANHF